MKNSKNKMIVFGIFLALILLIGGTYAWLTLRIDGKKTVRLHSGILSLKLDEEASEGISIKNAYPMTDIEGLATKGYDFTLTNDGNVPSNYTIYLVDLEIDSTKTRMSDSVVKYNLVKEELDSDGNSLGNPTDTKKLLSEIGANPNRILDSGVMQPGETYKYKLKTWMDYGADNSSQGTVFKTQIKVEGTQIRE